MAGLKRKYASGEFSGPRKVLVSDAVRKYVSKRVAKAGEKKNIVWNAAAVAVSTAGVDYLLSGVDAGTGDNQRIGDRIRHDHLKLKLYMYAADASQAMRVIVYRKTHSQTTSAASIIDWLNPDYYTVLYDRAMAFSGTLDPARDLNIDLSVSGVTQFNGNAWTDVTGGSIWLRVVSDSAAIGHPYLTYTSHLTFRDA